MRLVIGLFVLAVLTAAAPLSALRSGTATSATTTRLRAIHYDTNYDLSAQRRLPAE